MDLYIQNYYLTNLLALRGGRKKEKNTPLITDFN